MVTRSQAAKHHEAIHETSILDMDDDTLEAQITSTTSSSDPILLTLAKEQLKILPKFSGGVHEDVTHWLTRCEEVFDGAQLQSSSKFIAIQSYLVDAAIKWFRFNKSKICDWPTFKTAITKAYQPTIQQALVKLEQRPQLPDESVMEYHYDKLQLCFQADPHMSSSMILHYLIKGLRHHLIPHVIRRHPSTSDEFLTIAQDEERIFSTLNGLSSELSTPTHEYPTTNIIDTPPINAIRSSTDFNRSFNRSPQRTTSGPRPLMSLTLNKYRPPFSSSYTSPRQYRPSTSSRQCYSCLGFGHIAAQCPSRKNM